MIWLIRMLEPDRLPREQLVRVKASGAGPVTLRLSVEDSGDSLFDTAVLLDAIEVR